MKTTAALACLLAAQPAGAATYLLDDPASPLSAVFDTNGGRLTLTQKSDGFVWKNPDAGGGSTLVIGSVTQVSASRLVAHATFNGQALTLTWELRPASGELALAIEGASANLGGGLVYPPPFFPTDGSGFTVLPSDGGYVVPTTATTFVPPGGQHCMEWFGGTDDANSRAWLALVDTADDYDLRARTGTIAASTRLGAAPNWRGSNGNPARTANLLSYARNLRLRCLPAGGYVAMAKVFRQNAAERGWLKTFAQKQAENPALDLSRFLGAPICYLWGDGRSAALLGQMQAAGLSRAVIQVSLNHSDHQRAFPADGLAGTAWFDAVRSHGYLGGFYDIYAAVRTAGQGGTPYDGFYYLWPAQAYNDWAYLGANGQPDARHTISSQMGAAFAAGTRLPAHLATFQPDAMFFDVVCAVDLTEDYDTAHGHFATRSLDRQHRSALLNAAFANPTRRLLTATEQGRSWAVPFLHWAEGKFWLGSVDASPADGTFNDNSYPGIMVDVVDPTANGALGPLLADGYQVPLWDLVFHDCVVTTTHWHRAQNKYLYVWDHADRWSILRGQAPLLSLTQEGAQGQASRVPNQLTANDGTPWSTRWSVMQARFVQTFQNVCTWHAKVGALPMTDHRRLTTDRSVHLSEFSADGGLSGQGVAVNFGLHDGGTGLTGSAWNGSVRGQALSVPVAAHRPYAWDARPAALSVERMDATSLKLRFQGLNDGRFRYAVEASTDLTTWVELGEASAVGGAAFEFVEILTGAPAERFLRVRTSTR